MYIQLPSLLIINLYSIFTEGNLGHFCIHESENCQEETSICQIAILIQKIYINLNIPSKTSSHDTESLSINSSRLLQNLINQSDQVDSHLLQSKGHTILLTRMHE